MALPVHVVADHIKAQEIHSDSVVAAANDPQLDADPGPWVTWMFAVVIFSSISMIAATVGACKCRRVLNYWNNEDSSLVREYLQKMSIYNILILVIFYVVYRVICNYSGEEINVKREFVCLYFGEHRFLCLALVIASLVGGLIRYLSVGIAHSETYKFAGKKYDNMLEGHIQTGFNAYSSNSFKLVIGPYLWLFVFVSVVSTAFLYAPIDESYTDSILKQPHCLPGWPQAEDGAFDKRRLIPIIMLMFLPVVTVLSIEHFSHLVKHGFYTKVPGYYSVLNAPFVMIAITTTWTMWLGTLVVVWYSTGLGAGEIFSLWTLFYTCLDSMWLLFLGLVTGLQNTSYG